MNNLHASLGKAFSAGWPSWRSIRGGESSTSEVSFTIRLADELRKEAEQMDIPAHVEAIIAEAREESRRGGTAAFNEARDGLEKALISLVHDSNLIESAGTNIRITNKICEDVFRGREVSERIDERDPEYQEHLLALVKTHRHGDLPNVVRSRREVINHAKALDFMIDKVVLENQPLSEELILETHRILHEDINDDDVEPGQYRKHEVAISYSKPGEKKSICMRTSIIPKYMKDMVSHLNEDMARAEELGQLDPYTLAAKYKHQFFMIHSFADGNGRMSRIILNVLLLKYAGHVTVFGSEGNEKELYLEIVRRGSKIFNEEDMEVDFHDQTSHCEFARFVLTKSRTSLGKMWTWVSRRDKVK